jgi:hypothetical protein
MTVKLADIDCALAGAQEPCDQCVACCAEWDTPIPYALTPLAEDYLASLEETDDLHR